MRKILSIDHIEEWVKEGKKHFRTHAILEDGEEAVGYGKDFKVGDPVMVFLHKGVIKMQKKGANHG